MSIKDVLASLASSNLLDNVQAITAFDMTVSMILALGMGMFIFLIYRRIYQGPMFSGTFGISLVALSMISTVLILAVTSNVVLSLGMVGALSIVRFRTAVKDPLEIVFLFWSIETGIVLATGIFTLAVVVNVAIGCVLLLLVKRRPDYPYILVLKSQKDSLAQVWEILNQSTEHFVVRSRKAGTEADGEAVMVELDIEVVIKQHKKKDDEGRLVPSDTEFVDRIAGIQGVEKAILVTYNGSYMS